MDEPPSCPFPFSRRHHQVGARREERASSPELNVIPGPQGFITSAKVLVTNLLKLLNSCILRIWREIEAQLAETF